jgi:hypothetical protein
MEVEFQVNIPRPMTPGSTPTINVEPVTVTVLVIGTTRADI